MHKLITPVTHLISRMKYRQKFILLSILFLFPLVFLLTIWLRNLGEEIRFAQKETEGVKYIEALMPYMLQLQQHRGLANSILNGETASEARLKTVKQELAGSIAMIDKIQIEHGDVVSANETWEELKKDWSVLEKETLTLTPTDSFERHTALIEKMLELLTLAADNSGLTLDPQIDTFYLNEVMSKQLPGIMEYTARSRGQGNGILARKQLTRDEQVNLMLYKDKIENNILNLEKALSKAIGYNSSLAESVQGLGTDATGAIRDYLKIMDAQLIRSTSLTMKPEDFFAKGTATLEKANVLFTGTVKELDRLLNERVDSLSTERLTMLLMLAVTLLLVTAVFLAFYSNVIMTIRELQREAERIAAGDLSRRVALQTKDELSLVGDSFNVILQSLNGLLKNNQEISEQVAASSQQLSSVSNESSQAMQQIALAVGGIAEGAELQQAGAAENNTALQEMSVGINRIAEASAEVVEGAATAVTRALSGAGKLRIAVEQMQQIQSSVSHSSDTVRSLDERSQRIDELTTIIMDISSQTQLLSLNANIEAARAGEYGRGFAVVATEVAKLADQSKQSVEHITGVVEEIRSLIAQVQQAMGQTSSEAKQGLMMIRQADEEILLMKEAIQQVTGQIEEVSAAAEQLSAGTEQVAAAFADSTNISRQAAEEAVSMAAATEQQLASMEEVQASSESLSSHAIKLQEELARFTLAVE
ncbi:methyl-accepting chemotaxis protein [Paenibacillus albidus]|uniref:Methyl-accepting chemotaxis protein n=1 Tax=Paenibacillus albidus TaxID=2041023 RepID=A0A917CLV6_9BACL|nr:HAMP domain-containing methyl-accepting chemotaxis protein [Paenibacillus albidus]GGF92711.1 methyl-accepting chemotaxis protein [Paenibacillus albidus]